MTYDNYSVSVSCSGCLHKFSKGRGFDDYLDDVVGRGYTHLVGDGIMGGFGLITEQASHNHIVISK